MQTRLHDKRFLLTLGGWFLAMAILAALRPASCAPSRSRHPSFTTSTGRKVEIIRANYGTNHSYSTDSRLVASLRKRLPAGISRRILPRPDNFSRIERRPGLTVLIRPSYFLITNKTDNVTEIAPDAFDSDWKARIVTSTGETFPSQGQYSTTGAMNQEAWVLFKFDSLPLREPTLKVRVDIDDEEHEFTVKNPIDPATLSPYKPDPKPWKKSVAGYDVEIRDAYLRPFEGHSVLHLDFHFSQDGKNLNDQVARTYSLEGSAGINSQRFSTNEPVWKVNLQFSFQTNAPVVGAPPPRHQAAFFLSPKDLDRSPGIRPFRRAD